MFKTFEHFNFIKMGRKYLHDEAGLGGWAAPRTLGAPSRVKAEVTGVETGEDT